MNTILPLPNPLDDLSDLDPEHGFVLVVGAAGIDIKAYPNAPLVVGASNPGFVRNTVGGVARNIAENLARLDVPTILLSAVGNDEEGDRVVGVTAAAGVNCDFIYHEDDARTLSYIKLMREDGQLQAAITDYDITARIDSDYLQQHELLFATAAMVVIDGTLSEDALETLFELTAQYKLRVCADPTNPIFATKLLPYIDHMHLIVPNAAETQSLCGVSVKMNCSEEERLENTNVAREFVRLGAEIGVVTLGGEGLAYAHSGGGGYIRATQVEVLDATGAGDAFTAAVIFGLLNEVAIDEAMRLGATAAALTLTTRDTVFEDLSQERLYDELVV